MKNEILVYLCFFVVAVMLLVGVHSCLKNKENQVIGASLNETSTSIDTDVRVIPLESDVMLSATGSSSFPESGSVRFSFDGKDYFIIEEEDIRAMTREELINFNHLVSLGSKISLYKKETYVHMIKTLLPRFADRIKE